MQVNTLHLQLAGWLDRLALALVQQDLLQCTMSPLHRLMHCVEIAS